MKENEIINNEEKSRFEMPVEGQTAVIEYTRAGDTYSLNHTEVPSSLEGGGVGKKLAAQALDYIKSKGGKVEPRCSFINAYIKRHPEWNDIVAKD